MWLNPSLKLGCHRDNVVSSVSFWRQNPILKIRQMYLIDLHYQVSTSRFKPTYNLPRNLMVILTSRYHIILLYPYLEISTLFKPHHELHISHTSQKYVSACAHHLLKSITTFPRNQCPLLGHNSLVRIIFVILNILYDNIINVFNGE